MADRPFGRSGKTFIPLENNPEVMTALAHRLGLSPAISFHDVYSLTDVDLLALIPRPCHALLFVYPVTPSSEAFHDREKADLVIYDGSGADEPVFWIPQTIRHACGLMGMLYAVSNGAAVEHVGAESDLGKLLREAVPLRPAERAKLLEESKVIATAHAEAADRGDTAAPPLGEDPGHAFVTFVKGKDGHLYELEGRGKGPIDRGLLGVEEDVLSEKALGMGPLPFLEREEKALGVVKFSCTALAASLD